MEMSLKWSILLVLTAVVAVVISHQDLEILVGKQKSASVPVGSSMTLRCSLPTDAYERFRVSWRFNPSNNSFHAAKIIHNDMYGKTTRTTTVVSNKEQDSNPYKDNAMKHTLSDVKEENSGWYFCSITAEIPLMTSSYSDATEIVIMKSNGHTTYPSPRIVTSEQVTVSPIDNQLFMGQWMCIALGVSAFILIVLLVICAVLTRKRHIGREDPIYANTRSGASKQPSPRPGGPEDSLKPVSSSQNLRNPSPGQRYGEGKRRPRP